jgi:hypothetical protein
VRARGAGGAPPPRRHAYIYMRMHARAVRVFAIS